MITRVWRGRTSGPRADAYEAFLKETAYPDYGEVEGNRGWMLLRRAGTDSVEFMFVSFWDSMDALRRYAGDDPERPKYYAEDRAALLELPDRVDHYEVVDAQLDRRAHPSTGKTLQAPDAAPELGSARPEAEEAS